MDESTAAAATTTTTTTLTVESPTPATPLHHSSLQDPPNGTTTTTPTQAPPSSLLDLDMVSLKSSSSTSYTSLKDVLPFTNAAINSPTASPAAIISSGYQISIRNRLVKQAAWAYLQPMSASPSSTSSPSGLPFLRRNPLTSCLSFVCHQLVPRFTRILHRLLHAIRGQVST